MRAAKRNGSTVLLMGFAAISIALLPPQDSISQPSGDATFAIKAASRNLTEMRLGQLAEKNASTSVIRLMGKQISVDQIAADDQLRVAAGRANITLPASMNMEEQATCSRLSKLSGIQFDRAFMQEVVNQQKADVSAFNDEIAAGKVPELKQFASDNLAILQTHLALAQAMQTNFGDEYAEQKSGL